MVNSKHLSDETKSTRTILLRAKIPSALRTNDEAYLIETIENVIKERNTEKECICDIITKVVNKSTSKS